MEPRLNTAVQTTALYNGTHKIASAQQ